jgi:urease accessory protein
LCGDIVCQRIGGRSRLTRTYARAPLKLLTPRSTGNAAAVVMSSFGGGLVTGDEVPVAVRLEEGSACVMTTQSAGKAYRSDGRFCRQSLSVTAAEGSLLAWLPDPLCCFAGARFHQVQNFDLAGDANLVSLDWITSGRWARGERWAFDSLHTRTDVRVDGRLIVREALRLNEEGNPIGHAFRMGRFDSYAVLLVVGPKVRALVDAVEQDVASGHAHHGHSSTLIATARLGTHGRVVRVLGPDAQTVQNVLRPWVARLADVIGADPWARKW